MTTSFEARLARVIRQTLMAGTMGLAPVVLAGCDSPLIAATRCGDEEATYMAYLVVDEGAACPDPADLSLDDLSQLGCPCPVIDPVVVCEEAPRLDAPYDGIGEEMVGKDACGYTAVGVETGVCCGRPLLRDGVPVLASVGGDADWTVDADAPDLSALSATERGLLATYWREVARMEHASVASFARFTLALMAHGAPAALLADAQQAGLDEVRHAQDAFSLASSYAGTLVVPGPMDLSGATIVGTSLVALAVACAQEGCIGETIAAVEAAHRLVGTTDPAVARALRQVVDEEGQHAAMAWRALSWLLEAGGDAAWEAVEAAFAAPLGAPTGPEHVGAAVAHGLLGRTARGVAQAQAWDEVIEPAWRALRATRQV